MKSLESVHAPEDQLGALVGVLVATHATNPMSTRVVDTEIRALQLGSTSRELIIGLRDEHEAMWQEALERGIERNVFDVQNTHLTRLGLLAMCTGMSNWYRTDGPDNLAALCYHFVDLAMAMVRAHKEGRPLTGSDLSSVYPDLVPHFPWEPGTEHAAEM